MQFVHTLATGLKFLLILIVIAAVVLISFSIGLGVYGDWHANQYSGFGSISDENCNIAVLYVTGDIVPHENTDGGVDPDYVAQFMRSAAESASISGVMAVVNSSGWSAVGAEMIANEFKRSPLPVVGVVRESANSAGYLAASGADYLIASPFSDVGSIGVTMSYLDETLLNEYQGYTFVELNSAPFKDYMNPNKPLTDAERALLEADLAIWHNYFIDQVASNRSLDRELVAAAATGASMAAPLALDLQLIDALGDKETARSHFASLFETDAANIIFCEA